MFQFLNCFRLQKGITEVQSINVVGYLRKTLDVEKTDKEAFKVKSKKLEDNEETTARELFENQRKVKEDGGNDDEEEDNVVVSTSGGHLLDRLDLIRKTSLIKGVVVVV